MKRCFKVSIGHANSFLHSGNQRKPLGRRGLSDELNWRIGLRIHNLISGRLKNDFGEVDEVKLH
jgi:hypothetical protein